MISGDPNRPSGGPGGDVQVLTTLPGTLEKGGPGFILEFTIKVHGNLGHDKAQSHFIYYSPSTMPIFSQTWYLRKATMEENLTAPVARFLKKNSPRMSGFTKGSINQP